MFLQVASDRRSTVRRRLSSNDLKTRGSVVYRHFDPCLIGNDVWGPPSRAQKLLGLQLSYLSLVVESSSLSRDSRVFNWPGAHFQGFQRSQPPSLVLPTQQCTQLGISIFACMGFTAGISNFAYGGIPQPEYFYDISMLPVVSMRIPYIHVFIIWWQFIDISVRV